MDHKTRIEDNDRIWKNAICSCGWLETVFDTYTAKEKIIRHMVEIEKKKIKDRGLMTL